MGYCETHSCVQWKANIPAVDWPVQKLQPESTAWKKDLQAKTFIYYVMGRPVGPDFDQNMIVPDAAQTSELAIQKCDSPVRQDR